jgi:hypothetical protein
MNRIPPLLLIAFCFGPVFAQPAPRAVLLDRDGPWRDGRWALAVSEFSRLLTDAAGVTRPGADLRFPIVVRSGVNNRGRAIHYLLNYSSSSRTVAYPFQAGTDLLSGKSIASEQRIDLQGWGVSIVEETK